MSLNTPKANNRRRIQTSASNKNLAMLMTYLFCSVRNAKSPIKASAYCLLILAASFRVKYHFMPAGGLMHLTITSPRSSFLERRCVWRSSQHGSSSVYAASSASSFLASFSAAAACAALLPGSCLVCALVQRFDIESSSDFSAK